jgi:hypothetical protein
MAIIEGAETQFAVKGPSDEPLGDRGTPNSGKNACQYRIGGQVKSSIQSGRRTVHMS